MTPRKTTPAVLQFTVVGLLLICSVIGYILGRYVQVQQIMTSVPDITVVPDTRPPMPTVRIEGIRDGNLEGTIIGTGTRLFLGEKQVIANSSGSFRVPAGPFLTNYVTIHVPEWAQYVASKRGKKYYPVHSAQGQNIVPENRVYFRSKEEAASHGFTP